MLRQCYARGFPIWKMGDCRHSCSVRTNVEEREKEGRMEEISILDASTAEAGAAVSPARSQRSGSTAPAGPEAWMPEGVVAGGALQT